MSNNTTEDELVSFIKETLQNLYHIAWGDDRDLSAREFQDRYVFPTRDTGSPRSHELESALEVAREKGLTVEEERHHLMKIGAAQVAESITSRREGQRDIAWRSLAQANFFIGMVVGLYPEPSAGEAVDPRKAMARAGAAARYAKDPKQREKGFVKQCWLDWQSNPQSYRSKAAFARDMLDKCTHLTSQKKIEDWCRDWDEENRILAGTVSIEPA